jgi:hypothetical protein
MRLHGSGRMCRENPKISDAARADAWIELKVQDL